MELTKSFIACVGLLLLASGCKSPPTYQGHIKPIMEARCVQCHTDGGVAPFALTSYELVKKWAPVVTVAVENKTMPPWSASSDTVHYRNDPSLSDEHIAMIGEWYRNGMPEGESSTPNVNLESVHVTLDRVDEVIGMAEPYQPEIIPDDYRCFPVAWPKEEVTYLQGFNALPGNSTLVHHIAVYTILPQYADLPFEWEQEDEKPGYTCFGGPTGGRDGTIPTLLLSAWVPGNGATVFPKDIGIEVSPGTTLVFQVHYNTEAGVGQTDQSSFEFQLSESVSKRGIYAPWLALEWVLGGMSIPAGEAEVSHSVSDDPRWFFDMFISDFNLSDGFTIHSAMFHMHKLGTSGTARLLRADGEAKMILDIPRWDFDWQREYQLVNPLEFLPGDSVELTCSWNNTDENQPVVDGNRRVAADVVWGEGTSDEMCVVNLLITER